MKREIGSKIAAAIPPSSTMEMSAKAREMNEQGIDVIGLAGGEPDFNTPPAIIEAAVESLKNGHTHYSISNGIKPLRERIARKMKEENGIDADPDNVFVTPGGKFALYITIQALLNPGDEVILVTPTWVSYEPMLLAASAKVVPLEVKEENGYRLTKKMLLEVCTEKTKMLVVCSPCNPTGHVIDEDEAAEIAGFLEETGVYCLTDEIYERLCFTKKHCSIGAFEKVKDQVVTIMGFSKGYAMTGWRLGWICTPPQLRKYVSILYAHSLTCTNTFVQEAAVYAFDCIEEIEAMRKSYMERGQRFVEKLNAIDGVEAALPEGAFYAWVKFTKKGMNASEMCTYLLDTAHVAGVPGGAFRETENTHIRFAFAQSEEDLSKAAERIKAALDVL